MKIKRVFAILLCISLILIPVTGCQSNGDEDYTNENGVEATPEVTPEPTPSFGSGDPLEDSEEILRLLNERVGTDNFIEFFREMMLEHSEDPGSLRSPEGYLFREGDMVPEFFEATIGLEIGEISGIVETMFGYHIILRVPVNYDSVPSEYAQQGHFITLRQLAAMEDFDFRYFQWLGAVESNHEYSPEYEALDFAIIFENGPDFETAFSNIAPDTVMISSGNISISWAHLYVFLFPMVTDLFHSYEAGGMEIEWHEEFIENYTLAEWVLETASKEAISFLAYMYGIREQNIDLSDEDFQILDESVEGIIAGFESIEAFEERLRESGYYDFSVFMDFTVIDFGLSVLINALYGDEGTEFPDEYVAQFAEINGYLMAMHILRMKPGF